MSNAIEIVEPDTSHLSVEANQFVTEANGIVIDGVRGQELAMIFLKNLKGAQKRVGETFDACIRGASQVHKQLIATRDRFLDPLERAEVVVKSKLIQFEAEQEKARRAEEARLREVAKREEEERRIQAAEQLQREGDNEAAMAVISEPVVAPTVVVAVERPAVKGISTSVRWKHRVDDEQKVPREFLMVNEQSLAKYARAMEDRASVPGVTFYTETVMSARA